MTPHPVFSMVLGLWASIQPAPEGHVSLRDLDRFPHPEFVQYAIIFTYKHEREIARRIQFEYWNVDQLTEWSNEIKHCRYLWSLLQDASLNYYSDGQRRNRLRRLRSWIGTDAYELGIMPCYVPIEYFSRMD